MDTETIILSFSYLGIFSLMTANGFISFPSSQILYIICGYFISTGVLSPPSVVVAGVLGNTAGNIALYEVARAKGMKYLLKFGIFREQEMKKVEVAFKKKGAWFLAVGKLIPALKVFVPIPAGLGKMHRGLYTGIILATSAIWTIPFLSIGYFFGKSSDVFGKYAVIMTIIAIVVAGVFYKYINSEEVVKEVEK